MTKPACVGVDETFELILRPVMKDGALFLIRRSNRRKKKPVHVEFKVVGGSISGDFELTGINMIDPDGRERRIVF